MILPWYQHPGQFFCNFVICNLLQNGLQNQNVFLFLVANRPLFILKNRPRLLNKCNIKCQKIIKKITVVGKADANICVYVYTLNAFFSSLSLAWKYGLNIRTTNMFLVGPYVYLQKQRDSHDTKCRGHLLE